MKKHKLILIILSFALSFATYAQDNYTKGVQAYEEENYSEAFDYFVKALEDNPEDAYSYMNIASIYTMHSELGYALRSINQSIKYMPKEDISAMALAYTKRAYIYFLLDKEDKAIEDMTVAINKEPDNTDHYMTRAIYYYLKEEYKKSDKDFLKMIELDEGNAEAYTGLGRNAYTQKEYKTALKYLDEATKYYPNFRDAYIYRVKTYVEMKEYDEAAIDIIMALDLKIDSDIVGMIKELPEEGLTVLIDKLNNLALSEPKDMTWPYVLGLIHHEQKDLESALDYYKRVFATLNDHYTAYLIANLLIEMKDYDQATNYNHHALLLEPEDEYYLWQKGEIEREKEGIPPPPFLSDEQAERIMLGETLEEVLGTTKEE